MAGTEDAIDNKREDEVADGMDDSLVFRSLLQFTAIGSFFTTRYLLDVIFTPRAVHALVRQTAALFDRIFRAVWYAPVASLMVLYFWGSLQTISVVSWVIRGYILRAVLGVILDDTLVVPGWKKRHVWVPLAWWVTFTRVSSGREAPQGAWRDGIRWFICRAMPWAIRLALFVTLSTSWPSRDSSSRGSAGHDWSIWPHRAELSPYLYSPPKDQLDREPPPQACTSFGGLPLDCEDLRRIREFNTDVMPRMLDAGYRGIRKVMNDRAFHGHIWHVGHACPDPSKKSTLNEEDYGWNLFAQHALDNMNLGHCLVSCTEAEHVGAHHVRCTRSERCIQTCDGT